MKTTILRVKSAKVNETDGSLNEQFAMNNGQLSVPRPTLLASNYANANNSNEARTIALEDVGLEQFANDGVAVIRSPCRRVRFQQRVSL